MVIDEGEEQTSIIEEKETKIIPIPSSFLTITSLVEKEISKTLNETEKRSASNNNNNIHSSPERPINNNNTTQPPPLITLTKSRSPAAAASYKYPSHSQQQYLNTGSIMRGTPISSSTPTNKPINIDISSTHPHSHHYNNPRNDYLYLKSPKLLDRNMEQQQQQQQQQQQHILHQQHAAAAYIRQYTHHQQQQQQQQQQHKSSANIIDPPSADRLETLKADYVTSKYLTTTHSPSHERYNISIHLSIY
jgi:hypothetical protein